MNKNFVIIFVSLFVAVTAMAALTVNKMKVYSVCKDVRLYMDDGIYAKIEVGGIPTRTTVTVATKKGMKLVDLGTKEVTKQVTSVNHVPADEYTSGDFSLVVLRGQPGIHGYAGVIRSKFNGKDASASLHCSI